MRPLLYRLIRLLRNTYFWLGIGVLLVIGLTIYGVMDRVVLPQYTRYGVQVAVPDVMTMPLEEAEAVLSEANLAVEAQILRKPNLPRDVVIDQRPTSGSFVKPGRRIYVTINTGDTTTVSIPRVIGFSVREAQNRIRVLGLSAASVIADSVPSSHPNTVTKQRPSPGTRVPAGSAVDLWYSTGLGEAFVTVPDVTGLSAREARQRLLSSRLRSVVLGASSDAAIIGDQSPSAGTSVREGFEVRLRAGSAGAGDRNR